MYMEFVSDIYTLSAKLDGLHVLQQMLYLYTNGTDLNLHIRNISRIYTHLSLSLFPVAPTVKHETLCFTSVS
jgi:hypothetical protein